jgi:hypothetical protein
MTRDEYNDRRKRALLNAAQGIAAKLDGWSLRQPSEDWGGCLIVLHGPGGQTLDIFWQAGRKRGEIRGGFPKLPGDRRPFVRHEDEKRCRIGLNLTRPPEALAREIKRRLLPAYDEVFATVSRQVEKAYASHRGAEDLLGELVGICPKQPQTDYQRHSHEAVFRDIQGSARVTGPTESRPDGTVHLRLDLPGSVALEVLHLVAEQVSDSTSSC